MTVPLDNLYHYVESQLDKPATLYLFLPHGSKKLSDLSILRHYTVEQTLVQPAIICHDQEPLMYELHEDHQVEYRMALEKLTARCKEMVGPDDWIFLKNLNLQLGTYVPGVGIFDKTVLLHSEVNSPQVQRYQAAGFECAHYWSHAFIARDWFRFAQFDIRNRPTGQFDHMFLVYSRGWTNSREYRLKFIELLSQNNLLDSCKISMLKQEEQQSVKTYQFKNSEYQVKDLDMYDQIPHCEATAWASADYDTKDISTSVMSVILETVFDGDTIHLTEKTLRALACGHPFILAAGPGSLEYLRSYGFKTFESIIDESYDQETNGARRLEKICAEMSRLQNLSQDQLQDWYMQARDIANYNRQHFFSANFWNYITAELRHNLNQALNQVYQTRGQKWMSNRRLIRQHKPKHWQLQLQHQYEKTRVKELRRIRSASINQQSL